MVLDQGLRDDVARRALGDDDVHGLSGLDGLTRTAEHAREHENGRHGNHGYGDKHRDDVARRALGDDDVHGLSGLDGLTRTAEHAREHENGRHGNHGYGDKHAEDDGGLGALGCSLRIGGMYAPGAAVRASLGRRLNALRTRRRPTSGARGGRTRTGGVRCGSRGRSRGVRAESLAGGTLIPLIAMLGRRLNALRTRRRPTSGARGGRTRTGGVRCGSRGRSRGVRAESLAGGTLIPLIAMRAVVGSLDRPCVRGPRARPAAGAFVRNRLPAGRWSR